MHPISNVTSAFVGLLLGGAVCFAVQDVPPIPGDGEIRQILVNRIDEQKRSVGIVVGVVGPDGRRVVAHGELATDAPAEVNGDTVFEIGSITKVFTAILLADLAAEGALELETPVQRLLGPDVAVPTRNAAEITLLNLTTHSSGLPRMPNNFRPADAGNPYADYTVAQLYEFLASHELERDIGAEVEYSNLGTGLLRARARSESGNGLREFGVCAASRTARDVGHVDHSLAVPAGTAGHRPQRTAPSGRELGFANPRRRRRAALPRSTTC